VLVASYSYCYSEVITGQTNNATSNGYSWNMADILPPEAGIEVSGVFHRYTITKDPSTDATVVIRNEDAINGGYVYERNDSWDQLPGNTKVGFDPMITNIPGNRWGPGEIFVNGDGTISDANISYTYQFDTCYNPLLDPSCDGYFDSMYQYLLDNGLLGTIDYDDPYYDEFVQRYLEENAETDLEETEIQEEVITEEEETEERSLEEVLAITGAAESIGDAAQQQAAMAQLTNSIQFTPYYSVTIQGGKYEDSLSFEDKDIPDNRKALSNLASQQLHRDMVRLQYD
jgi:hypothetical protein